MILPNTFIARVFNIEDDEDIQISTSRGGNIQIGRRQSFKTKIRVQTPPIHYSRVGEHRAFLKQVGKNTPFPVSPPLLGQAIGSVDTLLQVKTAASAGAKVIELKGGLPNVSNYIMPDDMLNFASHSKAYWTGINQTGNITDPFDTNESGDITIRLSDPLLKPVAVDETVDFISPTITVIRTSNVGYNADINDSRYIIISFEAIEYI